MKKHSDLKIVYWIWMNILFFWVKILIFVINKKNQITHHCPVYTDNIWIDSRMNASSFASNQLGIESISS